MVKHAETKGGCVASLGTGLPEFHRKLVCEFAGREAVDLREGYDIPRTPLAIPFTGAAGLMLPAAMQDCPCSSKLQTNPNHWLAA